MVIVHLSHTVSLTGRGEEGKGGERKWREKERNKFHSLFVNSSCCFTTGVHGAWPVRDVWRPGLLRLSV